MKDHFDKIFWYVVFITCFAFAYLAAVTFITIPKDNVRFADTNLGFILGTVLSGGVGFLLGGSFQTMKGKLPEPIEKAEVTIPEITTPIDIVEKD